MGSNRWIANRHITIDLQLFQKLHDIKKTEQVHSLFCKVKHSKWRYYSIKIVAVYEILLIHIHMQITKYIQKKKRKPLELNHTYLTFELVLQSVELQDDRIRVSNKFFQTHHFSCLFSFSLLVQQDFRYSCSMNHEGLCSSI